ncbi:hypothetical protein BKA83DRAFT_4358612 [Pisolithus microcarpus]|nr:hypothetical protein BKA83DRAFT_4358612 [Pisolithus microcarpus]
MDSIISSLGLLVHSDMVGQSDLPLLCVRRIPLYFPHILSFHWRSSNSFNFAVKSTSCYQMISSMF